MSNELDAMDKTLVHLMIIGLPEKQKQAMLADMKNKSTPLQKRIAEKIQEDRQDDVVTAMVHIYGDAFRQRAAEWGVILVYASEAEAMLKAHMN